jgi:hypothetical protein
MLWNSERVFRAFYELCGAFGRRLGFGNGRKGSWVLLLILHRYCTSRCVQLHSTTPSYRVLLL